MALITPAQIWRTVKDVDLDGIRHASQRPIEILVASEDGRDADAFAAWLAETRSASRATAARHPSLRRIAARDGMPALDAAPACAVLVTSGVELPPALSALREHLARHRIPVVTVVVGDASRTACARQAGEWNRVGVEALDDEAAEPIAAALLPAIDRELHMAAAREFPRLRRAVSTSLIEETAKANAGYAFTTGLAETVPLLSAPLAVGDMVVLTKNQLLMCYRIVLAHGRDGEPRSLLGEIVGVLGGGVILRQAARQLVGLIPVFGLLPKVAIAYAGTWAVGKAMAAWASEGRNVTGQAVKRYSRDGLSRGRIVARTMYDKSQERVGRVSSSVRSWRGRAPAATTTRESD